MAYQPRPVMAPNGHTDSGVKLEAAPIRMRMFSSDPADPLTLTFRFTREPTGEERSKIGRAVVYACEELLTDGAGHVTASTTDAEPWPVSPYNAGTYGNPRTAGWNAFFQGKSRERCPFPPNRRDLLTGYQEGWDAALKEMGE